MASVLSGNYFYSPSVSNSVELSDRFRLCLFLLYSECVGLPALVWAFRVQHRHQKSQGRTSVFVTLLLHNDILELLLNLYIIAAMIQYNICGQMKAVCPILLYFWSGSRICGVFLQQMVVLERIFGLRHPFCSAHVFFPRCSIMVFVLMLTVFFLCEFFTIYTAQEVYSFFSLVPLVPLLAVMITSWIITCRKSPNKHHGSTRSENQDFTVLAVASHTAALYLVSVVLYCQCIWKLWVMSMCLLSLRVSTDALLCVLICREKHSQTHTTDLSTDPAAAQAEHTL